MPTDVTIAYASNVLTVSPTDATVQGQGQVQWTANIPTGWTVEVHFNDGKSPFPVSSGNRGEYTGTSEAPITTLPADLNTNGTWPYTVKLYDGSTQRAQPATANVVINANP